MHEVPLGMIALWAAITFVTPLAVALVPLSKKRIEDRTLHTMLGLSAGLLLGITFLNILPESFHSLEEAPGLPEIAVPLGVFAGFFVLFLVEWFMLRGPAGAHVHVHEGEKVRSFGILVGTALVIHGVLDGFVIPLGLSIHTAVGFTIAFAVALHQIPDSFAAVSVALSAGYGRRSAMKFVVATALDTPIGIVFGVLLLGLEVSFLPIALAFAAGAFLFVSAADLIPELHHSTRSILVASAIFLGFAFVAVLTLVFPAHG